MRSSLVCRGTRPDLCAAVTKITRRYHSWDRECDHLLFRIFQYLKGTTNLGILLCGHPDDWGSLQFAVECDADHGGDPAETKSTSGVIAYLYGKRRFLLIDWHAKKQTVATARSTGEAEMIAIDMATFGMCMPWVILLEGIFQRSFGWVVGSDSDAAIMAVKKGYSKKMAYLMKWQRISISALKQVYFPYTEQEDDDPQLDLTANLIKILGDLNKADLRTNAFDHERHWFQLALIGMQFAEVHRTQ